jgi:hypothetical protein
MARNTAARPADRALVQRSRIWWFASHAATVSDQTAGNILRRHGIAPVPERSQTTTWRGFIRRHDEVFIHLSSRRVSIAGITDDPDMSWMSQVARNATLEEWGYLHGCR